MRARRIQTDLLESSWALESGAIEQGVRALVAALNLAGFVTIASCEGHGKTRSFFRAGVLEQHPFVIFRGDIERAREINRMLGNGHGKKNELHFVWKVGGYFYPDDEQLVWRITPGDVRILDEFDRVILDKDLAVLAQIVASIGQAERDIGAHVTAYQRESTR